MSERKRRSIERKKNQNELFTKPYNETDVNDALNISQCKN